MHCNMKSINRYENFINSPVNKMYVLLIDDDEEDAEMFREVLHELDAEAKFESCENAQEGLDKLSSKKELPDYIFLDMNMPVMNGKRCLAEIRKKWQKIPVAIYSTAKIDSDVEEIKTLGANHYVIKPLFYDDLKNVLKEILKEKTSRFVL